MKKFLIGGIIVVLLGGYALWAASRTSQPTTVTGNQTGSVSATTTPGTGVGIGDTSKPGDVTPAQYKDGAYTGKVGSAAPYGNVQVQVTVASGKITKIDLLQKPQGPGETNEIAARSFPILVQEAITTQNSHVNIVSGATQNVEGFNTSLSSALQQAQI
ncbi:FMN-binding protein [Patescibacteria group bacterium]|nr:FMN-binding protein [Patescibacteria group bacterium]